MGYQFSWKSCEIKCTHIYTLIRPPVKNHISRRFRVIYLQKRGFTRYQMFHRYVYCECNMQRTLLKFVASHDWEATSHLYWEDSVICERALINRFFLFPLLARFLMQVLYGLALVFDFKPKRMHIRCFNLKNRNGIDYVIDRHRMVSI